MADSNNPHVSVIVPVYNVEKYLEQCLNSILVQTLSNIEIIVVNDGSTDLSGEICKDFANRDPRIHLINKENGGLASARNAGLTMAKGEYIGFVDSDDWIESNMYERMYQMAIQSDCDIVWTNVFRNENEKLKAYIPGGVYDRQEIEQHIFPRLLAVVDEKTRKESVLRWSNCLRIYRHNLIRKHQIRFDDRFRRCQDLPFTFECTIHAKKYSYLDQDYLYHNRVNADSLSRSYTKDMFGLIKPLLRYLYDVTRTYPGFDFSAQMDFRVFLSAIDCVDNEVKVGSKNSQGERLRIIKDIINDPLVRDAILALDGKTMKRRTRAYYIAFRWRLPILAYWIALWRYRRHRKVRR